MCLVVINGRVAAECSATTKGAFVTLAFGILTTGRQSQNDIILCPVHFLVFLCAVQSI